MTRTNREQFWDVAVQTATAMAEATGKEVFAQRFAESGRTAVVDEAGKEVSARRFAESGQQEHVRLHTISMWVAELPTLMATLNRRDRGAPFAVWLMYLPRLREIVEADKFDWFQGAYGNMLRNADRRLRVLCYPTR